MAKRVLVSLAALLCLTMSALADKHERVWQTGTVLDMESVRFTTYGGTTTQGHVDNNGNVYGTTTPSTWNHKRETVAIEGDQYIYVVSHVLSWRWSKEVKVVVGGTIEYAVDGDNLIVRDVKGKEFKMHIDKTILKKKPDIALPLTPKVQIVTEPQIPSTSTVVIKSTPQGADIVIDGKFVGSTPSTISLTAGEHTISIDKSGFKQWQRTITVTAGGAINLEATLDKLP